MKKLLVVEDSNETQAIFGSILQDCQITPVSTLSEAEARLNESTYDLMILDVNLPDGDGLKFCAGLRSSSRFASLPIIFVTGSPSTHDRIAAFSLGAEDYIAKPTEPRELRARVMARVNQLPTLPRNTPEERGYRIGRRGRLRLDLLVQQAYHLEESLHLTPLEFKLLNCLAQSEGVVLNRKSLLGILWADAAGIAGIQDRTIDAHISKLRRKLDGCGCEIKSIYRTGYMFRIIEQTGTETPSGGA